MNLDIKSEPKFEIEAGDYDDDDDQEVDSTENGDKMHDGNEDEHSTASDTAQSLDGVNQAVMQWYTKQEAEGVPVNNVDIDEAAERLAQELGFTDFKLNSTGWPLRFRKPQDVGKTTENDDDDDDDDDPGLRVKKVLRIQDQITAFQRLQAGESAEQIAGDLGVSKATILSVKKKLKDTLFTPSLDQNYKIKVENQTKNESENPYDETEDGTMATITPKYESTKETVWALIERRKRLKFSKNGIPRKDRSLTYDEKVEAIEQFKSGITLRQIARNFSVSNSTIHRVKKEFSKSHQLAYKNYMKLEEKVNVLERLDEGETIAEIAENIKVNESTVRSIKKNRIKIMNVFKASIRSISIAPATTPILNTKEKIEQKLLVWINDLKRRKMPIHSAMILKKALMIQMSISQEKGSSSSQTFTPSKDWLNSFKKRHNIQKHDCLLNRLPFGGILVYILTRCAKGMTLSKFAEGLREMYLNRNLPENPNRCNSFTPRIILVRQEQDPVVKYTMLDAVNYHDV
ncbi:Tigger transposable element-derived protein 2 [Chionoecetes opilio]|uniref:Tigger transposable element-derived protein 2 n=1 Tax=Chionoecetes opilio TaxID=41210 RepID=A0A8J4YIL3_CHIOP|nr:Tigger transposable element-derived protein 2 [Chionoecetes opilio]